MRTLLLTAMACTLLLHSYSFASVTNHPPHVTRYIDNYYEIAIREMHRSGIPASIILAQGILESSWGLGDLSTNSNNHFGIKCKSVWTGPTFYIEDDDVVNGVLVKSCFRVYNTVEESYIDHTNFLLDGDRYSSLFNYARTDYKNWAKGLKTCGYATDPEYDNKLITTIERYQLSQYDQVVPPVVSAPVFHIPAPEPMPQTVSPQDGHIDLNIPSQLMSILDNPAYAETSTNTESYISETSISSLDEETPPAAVNIEDYYRANNTIANYSGTIEETSSFSTNTNSEASFSIEEDHDEYDDTTEQYSLTETIPTSGPASTDQVINQLPQKEIANPILSEGNLSTTKSEDSHLQLMKGNMRISRKPRR